MKKKPIPPPSNSKSSLPISHLEIADDDLAAELLDILAKMKAAKMIFDSLAEKKHTLLRGFLAGKEYPKDADIRLEPETCRLLLFFQKS